ncbi:MAG: hypothetical protein Kow00109_11570 [Acidobacteriota bacterium]
MIVAKWAAGTLAGCTAARLVRRRSNNKNNKVILSLVVILPALPWLEEPRDDLPAWEGSRTLALRRRSLPEIDLK